MQVARTGQQPVNSHLTRLHFRKLEPLAADNGRCQNGYSRNTSRTVLKTGMIDTVRRVAAHHGFNGSHPAGRTCLPEADETSRLMMGSLTQGVGTPEAVRRRKMDPPEGGGKAVTAGDC